MVASPQIARIREYWDAQANSTAEPTVENMRHYDDYWAALTSEPGQVDYIDGELGGVPGLWVKPHGAAPDRLIICFHGGGYVMGSRWSHRKVYGHLAKAVGCEAFVAEYRLAPEYPHPAQSDDALAAYRGALDKGIIPNHIIFAGDSAGGGLALGSQVRVRDVGLPLPAGTIAMSAWTDMTLSGASYDANRNKDRVFRREMVGGLVHMVLGEQGDRHDPYASPISADLSGLSPIYLQAGGDEGIVDDSVEFAKRAQHAGVDVQIDVFPEMLHTFQMAAGRAPEADDAIARQAAWARSRLGLGG